MQKVLVVCMGNICRSPTAEAVLRAKAAQLKVDVEVDSAGTIGYHQGNPPDARSKAAGEKRGYSFSGIKARKIRDEDFVKFDWILAADQENLAELKARCPQSHQHKLSLMLSTVTRNTKKFRTLTMVVNAVLSWCSIWLKTRQSSFY